MRAPRPEVIVRTLKPESFPRERGMKNHYRMAALQIRNAEEALKLTPPLILLI